MTLPRLVFCLALLWRALPAFSAAPVGREFQANTYTQYAQGFGVDVAMDAEGDYVIVWPGVQQDEPGWSNGVFAQRFTSSGARAGGEFQVNTYTTGSQGAPSVAMESNGDIVVVWTSHPDQDGYRQGMFGQRFASSGNPLAGEFQINVFTNSEQEYGAVASDDDGDFVVVWSSRSQEYGTGMFARRFASNGSALGGEIHVNTYTHGNQYGNGVAMDADGDFVVAWTGSPHQDGDLWGIFAQRFSSAGAPLGGEFQVNDFTEERQRVPAVAMDASGDFVIAWESYGRDGSGYAVSAQRFASSGLRLGGELQVNTHTLYSQNMLAVAMDADGMFVVTWSDYRPGGAFSFLDVVGQRYSSTGARMGGEFLVNSHTSGSEYLPAIGMSPRGDFVVAWNSNGQDGSSYGAFARSFKRFLLDVDGNGTIGPLTDGILVLRNQYSLTGDALIGGAVDTARCTRCSSAAIVSYLNSIRSHLDVDADGTRFPLTDAILVLRYLFGFRGTGLTAGAVDNSCNRCTAGAVTDHLQKLVD